MRKILTVFLIAILTTALLSTLAMAGCQICTLLDGVSTTGAGNPQTPLRTFKDWGCKVKFTADSNPTALEVCLQGDPLGAGDFEDMVCIDFTSAQLSQGYAVKGANNQVASQIRGNVKTLTGGSNVSIDFGCTGVE